MAAPMILIMVVLVVVLLSLAGLSAVRQMVPRARLAQHTDVAGYVYAVIGVIYGVILAQVVVAAWDEYREARTNAAIEASAVLNLDRLTRGWPEPRRQKVSAALVNYAREVVDVEWPAMRAGDYSAATRNSTITSLWSTFDLIAGDAVGATANYAAALEQLDTLDDSRRNRFLDGQSTLPQTMTITLLLGGVITVGFSYLFAVEDGWLHGLITASLAVLVGLLLLLEYQLRTPFEGVDAIPPTAMELVLEDLD